jgi:hypothetical protein
MRKRTPIIEEKIAVKISHLLSAVDLDLDKVGFYLAKLPSNIHYNRLILMAESAVAEKERYNERNPEYTLFD